MTPGKYRNTLIQFLNTARFDTILKGTGNVFRVFVKYYIVFDESVVRLFSFSPAHCRRVVNIIARESAFQYVLLPR